MSPSDPNGRIRLTVREVIAWIGLLAAILGSWYDTRGQIALVRQEISMRVQQADSEHKRMWQAIDDARADTRAETRPKR